MNCSGSAEFANPLQATDQILSMVLNKLESNPLWKAENSFPVANLMKMLTIQIPTTYLQIESDISQQNESMVIFTVFWDDKHIYEIL